MSASGFAALDDADVQATFTREASELTREAYLAIEGMTCAACAQTIRDRIGSLSGVHSIEINVASGSARLLWEPQRQPLSRIFEQIAVLGYRPFPADDYRALADRRSAHKTLLWQFLVALLAMMQTMMYAWPGYIAEPGELPADVSRLFTWASWIMCLPVLVFSSRPFIAGAWAGLRQHTISMDLPVAIGIVVTFVASSFSMYRGGETYFDSMTMFVTFLLGGRLWEHHLRERIGRELNSLTRRLPVTVERLDADQAVQGSRVAVNRLRPGDRIRVAVGEALPADGLILSGESALDEALLTGEVRAVVKRAGDGVLSGSFNLSGPLLVCVTRTGTDSRYGQIIELMERALVQRPAIVQLADRYAQHFLVIVLVLAFGAGLVWWWLGSPMALWIAVSVLIVTCPCALSLAAPVSLLASTNRLLRAGVLVSRPAAIESLAQADHVVFDKTGTLTEPDLRLDHITILRAGVTEVQALAIASALERGSLHPVARVLRAQSPTAALIADEVIEDIGSGVRGRVDGHSYRLGRSAWVSASTIPETSGVTLADEAGALAVFHFSSPLRADAAPAVAALVARGLGLSLLSGDRRQEVEPMADLLQIEDWHSDMLPEHKYAYVRDLQQRKKRLVFVGDGVNDAPALGTSEVSVVMGAAAAIAQSRADFILLGNRLTDLVLARDTAQLTLRVIRQNLAWALTYNLVCVPLALAGYMPPWLAGIGMAASSLLVLINATRLLR